MAEITKWVRRACAWSFALIFFFSIAEEVQAKRGGFLATLIGSAGQAVTSATGNATKRVGTRAATHAAEEVAKNAGTHPATHTAGNAAAHATEHLAKHAALHAAKDAVKHASGHAPGHAANATTATPATTGSDILTLPQLEACVSFAKALDDSGQLIDAEAAALEKMADDINAEGTALDAQRPRVDTRNGAAVDAFNASVRNYKSRAGRYLEEVDRYERDENEFISSVDTYNAECAKRYRVNDMQVIKAKLGLN